MVKYTLHYFSVVGRAEQAHLMFHAAGVDYEYKTYNGMLVLLKIKFSSYTLLNSVLIL